MKHSPCQRLKNLGLLAQGITKSPHTSFLVAQYVHLQKQHNKKQTHLSTKTKSAETQCLGDATASYVDSHPSTWKKTRTCALWPPIREPSCRCAYFYLGPSIEPRLVRLPYVPTAQQKNKCTTRAACNSGAQVCSFSVYT